MDLREVLDKRDLCSKIFKPSDRLTVGRLCKHCHSLLQDEQLEVAIQHFNNPNVWLEELIISINSGYNVVSIKLGACELLDSGVARLAALIQTPTSRLRHTLQALELEKNNITSAGLRDLSPALNTCTALKKINLSYNEIEADGILSLRDSAPHLCARLEFLDLSLNELDGPGITALRDLLQTCLNSQTVLLGSILPMEAFRHFHDFDRNWFQSSLQNCRDITKLRLSDNRMGDEEILHLCNAIRTNCPKLKFLSLAGNRISVNGASIIADYIASCDSLQVLFLNENRIETKGALSILNAISQSNVTNFRLYFKDCGICIWDSTETEQEFCKIVQHCANLQRLSLEDNQITTKVLDLVPVSGR